MLYLLGEIVFCLFFAAMIGFAVGWLFRGTQAMASPQQIPDSRLPAGESDSGATAQLQAENDQLRASLESGVNRLRQIEHDMSANAAASSRSAQDLHAERERANYLQGQLEQAQAQLADKARALSESDALLTQQSGTLRAMEKRIASNADAIKSASRLAEQNQALVGEASKASQLIADVEVLRSRVENFDTERSASDERMQRLGQQIAAVTSQAQSLKNQVNETRQRLANAPAPTDPALVARLARTREQLKSMQDQILERDKLIGHLKLTDQAAPQAAQRELPIMPANHHSQPDWLLATANGTRDDLKRIYGIGPVLERTLNELGVFHFRQIAALSAADVTWLAAHINSFPDRIIRDRWVEQAGDLVNAGE